MVLELTPRQTNIFDVLVREYIREGEPIGSEEIAEEFGIPVSPATIRWELLRLQHKGLLAQPHLSSGRIPTAKGYRFFVDNCMQPAPLHREEQQSLEEVGEWLKELRDEIIESSLLTLSRITHAVSIFSTDEHIHSAGSAELSREIEFQRTNIFTDFLEFIDELEGRRIEAEAFFGAVAEPIEIFIGKEHPMLRRMSGKFSLVAGKWSLPEEQGVIALVGPTRMDYAHNRAVVEYLTRLLSQTEIQMSKSK